MESFRSLGPMLITAPTEEKRVYEMAVRLSRADLKSVATAEFHPWVRVCADLETGDVCVAAGIKVKR